MLIDTHCHLDFPQFEDRDEVIKRARACGIGYIINIGSSIEGSKKSCELALKYDSIYATVGIHPHEADRVDKEAIAAIGQLAKKDKVVAIGETGLDYFLPAGRQGKNYAQPRNQQSLFVSLIKLAKESGLPLVLHSRQAQGDTLKILKEFMPLECVVHCFSGDENFLKDCLDLGFLVSFTCNITYKKAQNLRNVVAAAPMERIMLETDAPYLSPEGLRGKRNEPSAVKILAQEIAKIKQASLEEVVDITTATAKKFFKLR